MALSTRSSFINDPISSVFVPYPSRAFCERVGPFSPLLSLTVGTVPIRSRFRAVQSDSISTTPPTLSNDVGNCSSDNFYRWVTSLKENAGPSTSLCSGRDDGGWRERGCSGFGEKCVTSHH